MKSREERLTQVAKAVEALSSDVSVRDLVAELGLSESYVRELTKEAFEKGYIEEPVGTPTVSRETRHEQVAEIVKEEGSDISVKDLADELGLSKSYVRELAREASDKGLIEEPVGTPTMSRETRHEQIAKVVEEQESDVAVKDIADKLGLSNSYICDLAPEAIEKGLIDGEQSVPVLGYIFNDKGQARADGGERSGELRVLTTRPALLQAVRDYAPHLLPEAQSKSLEDLREFVKKRVADGVTTVNHAWRFESV